MNRKFCITSAIVFAMVAMLHGWRFVLDVPIHIGAWSVPRQLSGFAAFGAACLAVWAIKNARLAKSAPIFR